MRIAARVAADGARALGIEIATDFTSQDGIGRLAQTVGQRLQQCVALLEQRQRRTTGRAGPKPRQFGEKLDQPLDLGTEACHQDSESLSGMAGAISSDTTSRTATISAPGKRSNTARTRGSCA